MSVNLVPLENFFYKNRFWKDSWRPIEGNPMTVSPPLQDHNGRTDVVIITYDVPTRGGLGFLPTKGEGSVV
jgi:hypothetical protein